MNICLLNDSFPPVIDGVVNVVQNYAEYLMKNHASQVLVGTPGYPDTDYSVYPYQVVPYQSFDTAAVTSGYRTGNPFSGKSVDLMAQFKPDIIHSHCPASSTVIARLLREKSDAPVVFTYHTKYDIDIRRVVKVEPVAREGIHAMVSNIEACDEVWAVSRGAGESLQALGYSGDFRVMHNGVDFPKGAATAAEVEKAVEGYDLPPGVPVYLFVGRMMTYKGLPLILDALKIVKENGLDFRMVFIGKGPDKELLEQKAQELGLMGDGPGRCLFTGPIYDRNVLRAWNTRADLFLFPSTFDTNGLVVREAAACGLASVLIKDSCAAEDVTDGRNGFLIEETPEAMAQLLCRLGSEPAYVRETGVHAMEELYLSWEGCVAEAYNRYQEILEMKMRGGLPVRKKLPTDYLVSATAKGMSEGARVRHLGETWFKNIRSSAAGMMENMLEAEEENMHKGSRVDNMAQQVEELMKKTIRKGLDHMKD